MVELTLGWPHLVAMVAAGAVCAAAGFLVALAVCGLPERMAMMGADLYRAGMTRTSPTAVTMAGSPVHVVPEELDVFQASQQAQRDRVVRQLKETAKSPITGKYTASNHEEPG